MKMVMVRGFLFSLTFLMLLSCSTKPKDPEPVFTQRRQADSLMDQGNRLMDSLFYDQAGDSFAVARDLYASIDDRQGLVTSIVALGRVRRVLGDQLGAQERYALAESLARATGDSRLLLRVLNAQADLELRRDDSAAALTLLREIDGEDAVVDGLERAVQLRLTATAYHRIDRNDEALALLQQAVTVAEEAAEDVEAAQSYYRMASIHSLEGRLDQAEEAALKALEADKKQEYGPGIASDLRALGLIAQKAGRYEDAADYFRRAWLAWHGLGRDTDAARTREDLENLLGMPQNIP